MANSSILGGERAPIVTAGKDVAALGPSDTSDSGSDVIGASDEGIDGDQDALGATPLSIQSDTDAGGTGERGSVEANGTVDGADIAPDHIETIGTAQDDDLSKDISDLDDLPAK